MKAVRFALLVVVLAVAGCGDRGPAGSGSTSPLRGRTFLSTAVTADGKPYPLAEKTRVRLQFTGDDRLIADAGCNTMQGSVRLDGGKIAVSDLASTGMGCPRPAMDQDAWLSGLLSGTPSWKLDGDTLRVTSSTTEITLTDRKVAEPDLALQGTKWTVDTIINGAVASSTPNVATATLTFDQDTVRVLAGCNSGSGKYQVSGNLIRLDAVATTRKACEPDVMTLENAVLGVLHGEVSYEIDSDRLILKQANGTGLQLRGQRA
jgi:heat shock protein HslJ